MTIHNKSNNIRYQFAVCSIIVTLVLLPITSHAADDAVARTRTAKQPHGCRADDARCIALQRDVCDPWNVTVSDKCTFVQADAYCKEDVNRINYLALFYCNNKILMSIALLTWMMVLFVMMTVTAEMFLCPGIEFLAHWLGMSPDIAGVTLFAFASGAPDLFTQVAALANGDHVDIELAVSATFGGGLFIICVVLAAVILNSNTHLNTSTTDGAYNIFSVPDKRSFIRDALAYLLASIFMLCLLWTGELKTVHGIFLFSGYFLYLGVCIATRSGSSLSPPSDLYRPHLQQQQQNHHQEHQSLLSINAHDQSITSTTKNTTTISPHSEHGRKSLEHSTSLPSTATYASSVMMNTGNAVPPPPSPFHSTNNNGEIVPLAIAIEDPGSPTLDPKFSGLPEYTAQGDQGVAVKGGNLPVSPRNDAFIEKRRRGGTGSNPMNAFDGITQSPLAVHSNLKAPFHQQTSPPNDFYMSFQSWSDAIPEILEDSLHLHGKKGIWRWFAYASAPLVLFMHATMPALNQGGFTMAYGALLALISPPFFLLSSWLGPHELGVSAFLTFWVSSSLVLFTLMFAINPIHIGTNRSGSGSFVGVAVPPPLSSLPGTASPRYSSSSSSFLSNKLVLRPRRCVLFAMLAFVQSIMWLNTTADEVVALFESIGRIWNIRRDILGATVLAWGETVPDLVAVVALAKTGQGTMAIAACFGGPVFNLLISMGGPIIFAAQKNGLIKYEMTSGVLWLVIATVGVLAFLMTVIPLRCGWKLPYRIGVVLLVLYALSQVLFLLAEGSVLS